MPDFSQVLDFPQFNLNNGGELRLNLREAGFFATVRNLYFFNTLVLPGILFLAGLLMFVDLSRSERRGWSLPAVGVVCFLAAGILVVGRIYMTHIEPYRLQIRTASFQTNKLSQPLRILHISDIQTPAVGAYEERVFERMRDLKPDLVLHTGDLIQPLPPATPESELPKITALFATLNPGLGKILALGHTDWRWDKMQPSAIRDGGIRILESEDVALDWKGWRLRVLGLSLMESQHPEKIRPRVDDWLAKTDPGDFTILMGHAPDFILGVKDLPIDLCLAGHTHGGQIRIPAIGPPVIFSQVPRAWSRGFREVGRTRLNVSAGIGSEHAAGLPAIRFNCPPEMTLIEVQP